MNLQRPTIIPTAPFSVEPGPDVTGPERTVWQTMRIWILPEIERRRTKGTWTKGNYVFSAQILFSGTGNVVRLNQEVRGLMVIGVKGEIARTKMKVGATIDLTDVDAIEDYELLEEDRNHGHITLLGLGGSVYLFFNALQNRQEALELLNRAEEFLSVARVAGQLEQAAAGVENLFSAAELTAKAHLISLILDPTAKSHRVIHSNINLERKRGNIDSPFVELFVELAERRNQARYSGRPVEAPSEANYETVARQIEFVRKRYKRW